MTAEALVPLLVPWIMAVVLAMARTGGFLLGLPQTSAKGVPTSIVAIAALSLSIALVGLDPHAVSDPPEDLTVLAFQMLMEFMFGFGIGFILQLALATASAAGEIIGVEMGLSFAAIADPMSSGQSTAPAAMLTHVAMQLLLALGLDRVAIRALAESLQRRPLGTATLDAAIIEMVLTLLDRLVHVAFSLALPLVGTVLCLKLGMAMLARLAPKLQIFNLAFVLTIGLGLVMLYFTWPTFVLAYSEHLKAWVEIMVRIALHRPA